MKTEQFVGYFLTATCFYWMPFWWACIPENVIVSIVISKDVYYIKHKNEYIRISLETIRDSLKKISNKKLIELIF